MAWLIIKLVLSVVQIPLWFIKFFHDVGVLPAPDGGITKKHYYYSMADNVSELGLSAAFFVSLALAAASAVLAVIGMKKANHGVLVAGNIVFAVSAVVFVLLFFAACTVSRGY